MAPSMGMVVEKLRRGSVNSCRAYFAPRLQLLPETSSDGVSLVHELQGAADGAGDADVVLGLAGHLSFGSYSAGSMSMVRRSP